MGKPTKLSDRDRAWFCRAPKAGNRAYRTRELRQRILVVCEGEKTEPKYFEAIEKRLPPNVAEVVIHGIGANTQSLVRKTKSLRDQRAKGAYPFDQAWVVFDRDSFAPDDFDNAIHMAEANGIKCAWSNEAFELWYILHFEDRQTGMVRDEYQHVLSRHLETPYQKNAPDMFNRLEHVGDRKEAARRAEGLREFHQGTSPHAANPCTTVDLLVAELMKFG